MTGKTGSLCLMLAVVAANASGCSSESSSGSAGTHSVPQDEFVTQFVKTICDNMGPCCGTAGYPYDAAKCGELGQAQLSLLLPIGSPNVEYDASAASSCILAVLQAISACKAVDLDSEEACRVVFIGKLPEGAACQLGAECSRPPGGEAECDLGKCVVSPRATAGSACVATCTKYESTTGCLFEGLGSSAGPRCWTEDGLYCNSEATCAALIAIGGACTSGGCDGGYCNAGTCAPLPAIGEPCGNAWQCGVDAFCADDTCVAKKPAGEACASSDECQISCNGDTCSDGNVASPELCSGASP